MTGPRTSVVHSMTRRPWLLLPFAGTVVFLPSHAAISLPNQGHRQRRESWRPHSGRPRCFAWPLLHHWVLNRSTPNGRALPVPPSQHWRIL
jgi:hypothetical protein